MTRTQRVTRKESIVAREVGGEMVLLDLEAGTYFGLNAVGGHIWTALEEQPRTQEELAALVSEAFDAEPDVIAADIAALLEDLKANGLVDLASY